MNFDIKTEQLSDDAYVISLAGEVDLYTAPEFKQQLLEVIGQGGKQVIVDFSNTTFIDSTTLGVLVGGVKRLRTNEGQLSLVCSDRNITKIFEITGLDRVFTIYPTRNDALHQLGVDGALWAWPLSRGIARRRRGPRRGRLWHRRIDRGGRREPRQGALLHEVRVVPRARRRRLERHDRAEPRRVLPLRPQAEGRQRGHDQA